MWITVQYIAVFAYSCGVVYLLSNAARGPRAIVVRAIKHR
jgi:hypothetical protein